MKALSAPGRAKASNCGSSANRYRYADRAFQAGPEASDPVQWAKVAADAAKVLEGVKTLISARSRLQTSGHGVPERQGALRWSKPLAGPAIDL